MPRAPSAYGQQPTASATASRLSDRSPAKCRHSHWLGAMTISKAPRGFELDDLGGVWGEIVQEGAAVASRSPGAPRRRGPHAQEELAMCCSLGNVAAWCALDPKPH